ncbi:TetR/AcrR family transcriptional regulator [Clostridium sp. FP1]|uniref:TetR/AcrR family transcriptional regulator n=1 Tax=Clostridium sp. FP1 TaxID=2724076 RepID=UPI001CCCD751|nr:TetR/AcrR family transcriptional regulator [Clostridium sp. FP1]MBZ9633402.1 TetR/AcrR family transcriptional regulator [Clostridium sp. FP1]
MKYNSMKGFGRNLNKRQEQKEQRRKKILSVSLDLFIRKGYNATKISDIAEKAGMSMGLFFNYFESKERVYEELVGIGLTGTKRSIEFDQENPLAFFETAASMVFTMLEENPDSAKIFVLMAQAQHNEYAPQSVKEMLLKVDNIQLSISLIKAGQENRTIREGNPEALSTAFWCSIKGIAEQLALYPNTPPAEANWIVDILRK